MRQVFKQRIRTASWALLSLLLALYAASDWFRTFRDLRRFYTNMWIWDPWDYLSRFDRYRRFDLTTLWIQHNEHRAIATELSYLADIFFFHGKQLVPEILGISAYFAAALLLAASAWYASRSWSMMAAGLLTMAIAGYKTCVISLNIPFLNCWPFLEFFAVAAFAALVLHKKHPVWLIVSIGCGIAATYSLANGMLVWPLLVLAAWQLGFAGRQLLAIAISGAFSIGLYFVHYNNLHSATPGIALQHPKYFFKFIGAFLSVPFQTDASVPWGWTLGWIALAIAVIDLAIVHRRRLWASAPVIVAGGFIALAVGSAFLAGVGRMDPRDPLLIAARAGRYTTEPTLFWCALVVLTMYLLSDILAEVPILIMLAVSSLASIRTLPSSSGAYHFWEGYFRHEQWATIGFANGVTDTSVSSVIFPAKIYFDLYKHVLIDNRLAIFADAEPGWIGKKTNNLFQRAVTSATRAEVLSIKKLGTDFEVEGWLDGATEVVFVDAENRIIGFGQRPSAGPETYSPAMPPKLAFIGFIRGEFASQHFTMWAVDGVRRTIYPVGKAKYALP